MFPVHWVRVCCFEALNFEPILSWSSLCVPLISWLMNLELWWKRLFDETWVFWYSWEAPWLVPDSERFLLCCCYCEISVKAFDCKGDNAWTTPALFLELRSVSNPWSFNWFNWLMSIPWFLTNLSLIMSAMALGLVLSEAMCPFDPLLPKLRGESSALTL